MASATSHTDPHADDAHHAGGGHDHGESEEPLGPIDWRAWGAAIGGIVIGLLVAGAFYLSLNA